MTDPSADAPLGKLTIRTLAMPADANPAGDIFGGWVLAQMDIAGGVAAYEIAGGRVVTAAIDALSFLKPVKIGDVLCVYVEEQSVGNTSLKVHVEAWALRQRAGFREKVTEASFTFVALDADGNPRSVRQGSGARS